jgi:predicted negative regulator of RcsB-dependent stress response
MNQFITDEERRQIEESKKINAEGTKGLCVGLIIGFALGIIVSGVL